MEGHRLCSPNKDSVKGTLNSRAYEHRAMILPVSRTRIILVAVVGLLIVASAGAVAQTGTQTEEEPNDLVENATTIELDGEGATITGELQPVDSGGDFDSFNFTLQEGQAVNVTVSISEETNRYVPVYLVRTKSEKGYAVDFTRPFAFPNPGDSVTFTISKQTNIAAIKTVSGQYTLQLLPVDPSSPLSTSKQPEAVGPYTITIEPIDTADSPPTETPSQLPNTLSIRSTGDERVYYDATVSGAIAPGQEQI